MPFIAVLGLGYVGLSTAAAWASLGYHVVGHDVDEGRVVGLKKGIMPFEEANLEAAIRDSVSLGNLRFDSALDSSIRDAEFVFICVPTPAGQSGEIKLDAVIEVCKELASKLSNSATIVVKSTLPLGGLSRAETLLAPNGIEVVYNPEFLRQGSALADFLAPDRIVIGSKSKALSKRVSVLFDGIPGERILTDGPSAELIKLASNSYLAMRLSFANEMAALSEGAGASFAAVARGMGLDSRIGLSYFKPGPGWGGSCLPKDCSGLNHSAALLGIPTPLLSSIPGSNLVSKTRVIEVIREMLGGQIRGKTVAIWGVAFKAGTDDMRGSPSLEIIDSLESQGATVKAYEPSFSVTNESSALYSSSALDAVSGADALAVLSESDEFKSVPAEKVHELMRSSQIFDVRGVLDRPTWSRVVSKIRVIGEAAVLGIE